MKHTNNSLYFIFCNDSINIQKNATEGLFPVQERTVKSVQYTQKHNFKNSVSTNTENN